MRWGRERQERAARRDLILEAERIVEGRSLESYISRRQRVPAWSLVALLGHASRLDLMRLAAPATRPDPTSWSGTVARLAGDLVMLSWDQATLLHLQRRALIPLELDLLGRVVDPPTTPSELYRLVVETMDRPLFPEF